MLVFDLRSLASAAITVDDVLSTDDGVWTATDHKPAAGVRVTGRMSSAGPGRFYFSGQIAGTVHDDCRRCLRDVEARVGERVQLVFAESGADDTDDPDVYVFDPRTHELDMRPAVREQWLLAVPAFVQCREDCAGLCATCGADLNAGPCGCEERGDARWAGIRHLGSSAGHGGPSGAT